MNSSAAILAVNVGSSSLKYALYPVVSRTNLGPKEYSGHVEGLETQSGEAALVGALEQLREEIAAPLAGRELVAIAHRVVHGGGVFRGAVRITTEVLATLERFSGLAPLHQPHNLTGVRACMQAFPKTPQTASFDTAFHASLPEVEHRFAIPEDLYRAGIRRYGFHGLSYQYLSHRLAAHSTRAKGRVVMAHLGNGASLCATVNGQSRATTMGFSALDGLVMGTRSGAIDAGVVLHLLREGKSQAQLERLLYKESGLLGLSGESADMRSLRASGAEAAKRAISIFEERVVREMGALIAILGGVDLIAFTGGIGENDAALRQNVCDRLAFLGVELDPNANASAQFADGLVNVQKRESRSEVWIVQTDEGSVAASEALAIV
jgi:acetate kinase